MKTLPVPICRTALDSLSKQCKVACKAGKHDDTLCYNLLAMHCFLSHWHDFRKMCKHCQSRPKRTQCGFSSPCHSPDALASPAMLRRQHLPHSTSSPCAANQVGGSTCVHLCDYYHHWAIIRDIHYIKLHYITLHYTTLHYITLHYITKTLHYITLHTCIHIYIHANMHAIHPSIYPSIHTSTYTSTHTCKHACMRASIHPYKQTYIRTLYKNLLHTLTHMTHCTHIIYIHSCIHTFLAYIDYLHTWHYIMFHYITIHYTHTYILLTYIHYIHYIHPFTQSFLRSFIHSFFLSYTYIQTNIHTYLCMWKICKKN